MTVNLQFQWICHPKAEAFLMGHLQEFIKSNHFIKNLEQELIQYTSTRLFDWLDHFVLAYTPEIEKELVDVGFVSETVASDYRVFYHPGAQLPHVVLNDHAEGQKGIAVTVDSIADFLLVRGMSGNIEGGMLGIYRRCCVSIDNGTALWVIERRGSHTMEPSHTDLNYLYSYLKATEMWQTRSRYLDDEDEAMRYTLNLAAKLIDLVGQGVAAWIVLECERKFWQAKNTAAQIQKNRQDRLGMGWANHDHHTFRSSRRLFSQLVRLFEMLGFTCRERFYAGQDAGWGAQVMEHPQCRLVLFLDVDLTPEEVEIDFRHTPLPELDHLSTVGLWCALHGDSILRSGMHHLEAQFLFEDLKQDLSLAGVGMMDPFSDFPYLKQAFTKGEVWRVENRRIDKLFEKQLITEEQAEKFRTKGALGSHMENLQRREGYKGFNQKNVNFIIKKTDPREVNF